MNALDVMAQDLEALRRERDEWEDEANRHARTVVEFRAKFEAERERADALAALTQEMTDVAMQEGAGERMRTLISYDAGPAASLAQRDARMKAEALEAFAQGLLIDAGSANENGYHFAADAMDDAANEAIRHAEQYRENGEPSND